jgi:hypothetical protein
MLFIDALSGETKYFCPLKDRDILFPLTETCELQKLLKEEQCQS